MLPGSARDLQNCPGGLASKQLEENLLDGFLVPLRRGGYTSRGGGHCPKTQVSATPRKPWRHGVSSYANCFPAGNPHRPHLRTL